MRTFAVSLCLIIPCLAVMIVPYFNAVEPRWNGIPFFYWYQLAWAPLSALFLGAAYVITERGR